MKFCRDTQWSKDLTANYESYSQYSAYGLGVCILKDGEVVAEFPLIPVMEEATRILAVRVELKIEVVTREDYRRKGLAYIGAAQLLLECDKRGLYPNWDAANKCLLGWQRSWVIISATSMWFIK